MNKKEQIELNLDKVNTVIDLFSLKIAGGFDMTEEQIDIFLDLILMKRKLEKEYEEIK